MKLRKFNQMNERQGFDDIDQPYNWDDSETQDYSDDEDEYVDVDDEDYEDEEEEEDDEVTYDEEMENLASHIRKFVKIKFDNSFVFIDDDGAIAVQFLLNKTEKMASIMKAMNCAHELSTDSLIEYTTEFELWRTTKRDPLITVRFIHNENVKKEKDGLPF